MPARVAVAACRVIVVLIPVAAWRSEVDEMTMELRIKLLLIKMLQPIAVDACWRGVIRKSYRLHGSLSTAPAHIPLLSLLASFLDGEHSNDKKAGRHRGGGGAGGGVNLGGGNGGRSDGSGQAATVAVTATALPAAHTNRGCDSQ